MGPEYRWKDSWHKLLEAKCYSCELWTEVPVNSDQLYRWQNGMVIQKAMPKVSADLRELLISGLCGKCFDELFKDEEADVSGEEYGI